MKIAKSLIITMAFFFFLVTNVTAQTEGNVVVKGVVTNNTPGGSLPIDAPVTLQFFEEGVWTDIYTSTIQNDGTFLFSDLDSKVGNSFVTRVVYDDAEYFSEPVELQESVDVEILIFESTEDASQVQIDQAHFFIAPIDDSIQIAEYYLIGNSGDKTYIGQIDETTGGRETINFYPPSDAFGLIFDGPGLNERFVGDESRFADTRAVPPGSATIEVSYVYELALKENQVIESVKEIPIANVVFIVSGGEYGLEGPGVEFTGIMDTQMGPAASYTAGPLDANELLSFSVVPLEEDQLQQSTLDQTTTRGIRQRDPGREVAIGAIVLVIAVLLAYQLWQAPAKQAMPDSARNLVQQIAELDQEFDAGDIDESRYQAQRASLKRRIQQILRS